jgi:putative hydrolase of the HAD superfamily
MNGQAIKNESIKAVVFDYGMVLTAPAYAPAWERMKKVFGAGEEDFYRDYWKYRHAYDRGDLGGMAYWNSIGEDLGKPLLPDDIAELLAADIALWTQPNQPMLDWAMRLQKAGFKTGLLSNLGDLMEPGILAHLSGLAEFDHHTFSHRLNIAKPEPEIYRHSALGLGVPLEQILFVDDREENIRGAEAVGMQAIQYTRQEDFEDEMRRRGLRWLLEVGTHVS